MGNTVSNASLTKHSVVEKKIEAILTNKTRQNWISNLLYPAGFERMGGVAEGRVRVYLRPTPLPRVWKVVAGRTEVLFANMRKVDLKNLKKRKKNRILSYSMRLCLTASSEASWLSGQHIHDWSQDRGFNASATFFSHFLSNRPRHWSIHIETPSRNVFPIAEWFALLRCQCGGVWTRVEFRGSMPPWLNAVDSLAQSSLWNVRMSNT